MDDGSSEPDDNALLRGIQSGRHEAFASLVRRHPKRLYGAAHRIAQQRDDAEDLVQAAVLKLWERPDLWDQRRHTHARFPSIHRPGTDRSRTNA